MDRRNFLRTGSLAMLGSLAVPSLAMPASVRGALGGADNQSAVASAMVHFGVTEADLKKVMAAALEKGGDYADLYFEHTFNNSVVLMDGKVNNCGANIDFGMGVRVLAGDQTGYAYVEGVTMEEMLRAARTAARIASSGKAGKSVGLTEKTIAKSRYAVTEPWEDVSVKAKIPYLEKLNEKIFSLDNRVRKVQASLSDSTSHVLFCNSEGVSYYDYRPMVSFMAVCIMEENGKMENGYAGRSYRKGFEFMTDDIVDIIAREAVDKTAILFKAVKPKGGEMPVVMGAGGSGILLHEAIGHAFEADFNRKRTSIFCDLLGKKVCDEHINVVDDGTIAFNRGAVHARISAKHYGVAPTGNGRRDTFRNTPIPRMRATYMEAGNMKEADIISTVKKGIYCDQFTNGQVQIGAGDFTFFVKSGYLIEDGKLTQPVKDINIIGNGPKALADITMVANNDKIDNGTWTCGKDGQSCPVTCGMPSALVSKLTVGGES